MKKVEKEKLNSFNYETKQRDQKQKEEKTCILWQLVHFMATPRLRFGLAFINFIKRLLSTD